MPCNELLAGENANEFNNLPTWKEKYEFIHEGLIEKEFIKRNLNSSTLDELIQNIEMMENLDYTLSTLKSKGYELRILSGGIDYVIKSLLK